MQAAVVAGKDQPCNLAYLVPKELPRESKIQVVTTKSKSTIDNIEILEFWNFI